MLEREKMTHKENDERKICFYCSHIFCSKQEGDFHCPKCGSVIREAEYEKVMKNVRQAVFRGWTCKIQYENEDDGKRYYTEQCSEILNFLGLAIVSGLIGNISYDIVKIVIKNIVQYIKNHALNKEDKILSDFLDSPEKIKKFSEYISAYYDEYENAGDRIKDMIKEEVFVEQVSTIIDSLIKIRHPEINPVEVQNSIPHTKDEILKLILEMEKENEPIHKLQDSDFVDFWGKV